MKNKHLQFIYFDGIDAGVINEAVTFWMANFPEYTIHHVVHIGGFAIGVWYEN